MEAEPYLAPPGVLLAMTEAHRTFVEFVSLGLSNKVLRKAAQGDGHGVMVLPGFLGDDGGHDRRQANHDQNSGGGYQRPISAPEIRSRSTLLSSVRRPGGR